MRVLSVQRRRGLQQVERHDAEVRAEHDRIEESAVRDDMIRISRVGGPASRRQTVRDQRAGRQHARYPDEMRQSLLELDLADCRPRWSGNEDEPGLAASKISGSSSLFSTADPPPHHHHHHPSRCLIHGIRSNVILRHGGIKAANHIRKAHLH